MKYRAIILILIIVGICCADDKLDRIMERTEETGNKVDTLYEQYKNDPLKDKTFGVEFNLVRMIAQMENTSTFSGGFSYFGQPMVEYYFPWYYYNHAIEEDFWGLENTAEKGSYDRLFYTDARVRMFTGRTSNGFFMSALTRFAYLESSYSDDWDTSYQNSTCKWGIGFGIGWRTFAYNGFNWGFSLSVGRYFTGENSVLWEDYPTSILFLAESSNDHHIFVDIELLKFGFAF